MAPKPCLESLEHHDGLGASKFRTTFEVVTGFGVNLIKLTDPLGGEPSFWMIDLGFLELPEHMRPTSAEPHARTVAGSGFMCLERIANDNALVPTHEFNKGILALVVFDLVTHDPWRGDAPHLPWLTVTIESLPTSLVEPDDRLCESRSEQRVGGWFQLLSDRVHLVPQSLRRDHQAVST